MRVVNSNYSVGFWPNNSNALNIFEDNKIILTLALPPTKHGCDIINLDSKKERPKGYEYKSDCLIVVTNERERKVYHDGYLIGQVKRKIH